MMLYTKQKLSFITWSTMLPLCSVIVSNKLIHFISGFWNLFLPPMILLSRPHYVIHQVAFLELYSHTPSRPSSCGDLTVLLDMFDIRYHINTLVLSKNAPILQSHSGNTVGRRDIRTDQLYMCKLIWAPSTLPLRYTGATPSRGRACSRSRVMSAAFKVGTYRICVLTVMYAHATSGLVWQLSSQ